MSTDSIKTYNVKCYLNTRYSETGTGSYPETLISKHVVEYVSE